ncbi:MAG: DUF2250 domain-containing protein [Acidilobus sp.]
MGDKEGGADELSRLSPLELYILLHLKRASVDYAGSISRNVKVPVGAIVNELDRLEGMGLVRRRVGGSSIKRSEARFKLSDEVRKHHTYYELSEQGETIVRLLSRDPSSLSQYFEGLSGHPKALELLLFLDRVGNEHAGVLAKVLGETPSRTAELMDRLADAGLVVKVKEKVLKSWERKAKPKAETRTHHTYYSVSRLTSLIIRYTGLRRLEHQ